MSDAINTPDYPFSLKHTFFDQESLVATSEDDRLIMRGKKPQFKRIDKSLSLNFEGRVKKASRKNIQLEYKFKADNSIRKVLQCGKATDETYSLDFGYPFTPIQAFGFALGLFYFRK